MAFWFTNVFGAAFLLAPILAYPAILHVPAEHATIQEAVDAASDGDTVLIADGTYTGAGNRGIHWDATTKHLVIKSENGRDFCVIDCQEGDRAFLLNQGQDRRDLIGGLTICNGKMFGPGGAICIISTSPRILNCLMEDNSSYCINIDSNYGGGAMAVYDSAAPLIQGNIIRNNSSCVNGGGIKYDQFSYGELINNIIEDNISMTMGGGGISINHFSAPRIINNLIVNNTSDSDFNGGEGGGISSSHSGPLIINNTIAFNHTGNFFMPGEGGGIAISKWLPQPVIKNCIIWSNESGSSTNNIQCEWNQWMDISYCNVEEDLGHIFELLPHTNLDSPPRFTDPDNGNFQLLPGSPSVNMGTPDTAGLFLPSKDLEGGERILEERIDMGAYECKTPTGLNVIKSSQEFRVYPNPSSGQVFLENLKNSNQDDLCVILCDASGKKIYENKLESYDRITPIFLGKQEYGLYFLTILSEGQVFYRQKIVRN